MHFKTLITLAVSALLVDQGSARSNSVSIKLVGNANPSMGCFVPSRLSFELSNDCDVALRLDKSNGNLLHSRDPSRLSGSSANVQRVNVLTATIANAQRKILGISGSSAKAEMIRGRVGYLIKVGNFCMAPRFIQSSIAAVPSKIRIVDVPCTDALLLNQFEFECFNGANKVQC